MPIPLFSAFILHNFTPSFLKSSSTSFIHLSLSHPLPLLPCNFPSKIFFTDLVSFIPNIPGMIKSMKVRWVVHVAWMGKRREACRDLVGKPKGKGRIIFQWILKKKYGKFWTVLIGLRTVTNGEFLRTRRS